MQGAPRRGGLVAAEGATYPSELLSIGRVHDTAYGSSRASRAATEGERGEMSDSGRHVRKKCGQMNGSKQQPPMRAPVSCCARKDLWVEQRRMKVRLGGEVWCLSSRLLRAVLLVLFR